jgi:hypothetical protein
MQLQKLREQFRYIEAKSEARRRYGRETRYRATRQTKEGKMRFIRMN